MLSVCISHLSGLLSIFDFPKKNRSGSCMKCVSSSKLLNNCHMGNVTLCTRSGFSIPISSFYSCISKIKLVETDKTVSCVADERDTYRSCNLLVVSRQFCRRLPVSRLHPSLPFQSIWAHCLSTWSAGIAFWTCDCGLSTITGSVLHWWLVSTHHGHCRFCSVVCVPLRTAYAPFTGGVLDSL